MTFVHGQQIIGRRETQEDSLEIVFQNENDPRSDVLMLLADGMGGHAGGEVASDLALKTFSHHFTRVADAPRPADRLKQALEAANDALRAALARDPTLRGMGCTLVAAIKLPDRLVWVSVGDSAIYLLRRGMLKRINADHSVFGELMALVEAGRLTRAEAAAHPQRHVLKSAVTGNPLTLVDVNALALEAGDVILLASDGLDSLAEAEVVETVNERMRLGARAVAEGLLAAVERKAVVSQDNTSVIVYRHQSTRAAGAGLGLLRTCGQHLSLVALAGAALIMALAGVTVYAAIGGFAADPRPPREAAPRLPTEMRQIPVPIDAPPAPLGPKVTAAPPAAPQEADVPEHMQPPPPRPSRPAAPPGDAMGPAEGQSRR